MFGFWKSYRRKRVLAKQPRQDCIDAFHGVWQWRLAAKELQEQGLRWCKVFVAEKNWEGCQGLRMTEPMKWTIAGQVALLTTAYPEWFFDQTLSILVYPEAYVASNNVQPIGSGVAIHGESARAGEAWYRGPVILNWADVVQSSKHSNRGHSIAIHEFSHQMDMVNSPSADGVPPLPHYVNESHWRKRIEGELRTAREFVANGHRILIDDYGLTSEGEFFAVSSELYFQLPNELAEYHPGVFELLREFYQRDWRA